jgi:D-alanyl-D-alanine carboxypeptidase (penicillin-binding protein 5/6)
MKRFLAFFLIFLCSLQVQAKEIDEPTNLYAKAAVLMDGDSGRILFQKNGEEILAMASTTKIMTCIVALENAELDEIITCSKTAVSQPKVHLGMREDEEFYLKDLLYSLMLESHNDSAVAIAEHLSGTIENFARLMNHKAKSIGCQNTYFVTPNGLDASDANGMHATTAEELAKIMRYCIYESKQSEKFIEITQTRNYSFQSLNFKRSFQCQNKNALFDIMSGVISGKTGFTGKAGYCYVGAVEKEGKRFIVALLACGWPNNKNYKWKDCQKLIEYGTKHFNYESYEHEIHLPTIEVQRGVVKNLKLEISNSENELCLLKRQGEKIRIVVEVNNDVKAPVLKGEEIGKVKIYLEDEMMRELGVVASYSVDKKTLQWNWSVILQHYFL